MLRRSRPLQLFLHTRLAFLAWRGLYMGSFTARNVRSLGTRRRSSGLLRRSFDSLAFLPEETLS